MLCLNPSLRTLDKKTLKALVPKASNHEAIVTRYVTSYKAAARSNELVECDGKIANAAAGRVIHGIAQRTADTGDADFADAACAERGKPVVRFVDERDVEPADIGVDR